MKDMIIPAKQCREDTCPKCYLINAIEIYDMYNKPLNFKHILDINSTKLRDMLHSLGYMKCKYCNTEFKMDWRYGDIPRPLFYEEEIRIMKETYLNKKESIINELNNLT